jgi:AhpD family alkylhydroperoxidase
MNGFSRRFYQSPRQVWGDLKALLVSRRRIRALMRGESISPQFRERLMLAVTAVNGCRYCSFFHAEQALKAGLADGEIRDLCAGSVGHCPEDELAALLYAQHWAETGGQPDPEVRAQVRRLYGEEQAEAIELSVRLIQAGNLLGNTFDYILYTISLGRWDVDRRPRTAPGLGEG